MKTNKVIIKPDEINLNGYSIKTEQISLILDNHKTTIPLSTLINAIDIGLAAKGIDVQKHSKINRNKAMLLHIALRLQDILNVMISKEIDSELNENLKLARDILADYWEAKRNGRVKSSTT